MNDTMTPLLLTDSFLFSCSEKVSCFNDCCRDLNQFLTPYDILRLKQKIGISSTDFLNQYTTQHTGPKTGLPVITLKTDPASALKCPFVTPRGCRVYDARPSSCRMYPLARIVSRSRETGEIGEHYLLIKESHCLGFEQNRRQTVQEWITNQKISVYNEMNDLLMKTIAWKNRLQPGPLNIHQQELFRKALYDLDEFRNDIYNKETQKNLGIKGDIVNTLKDDVALLKFGFKWIKDALLEGK